MIFILLRTVQFLYISAMHFTIYFSSSIYVQSKFLECLETGIYRNHSVVAQLPFHDFICYQMSKSRDRFAHLTYIILRILRSIREDLKNHQANTVHQFAYGWARSDSFQTVNVLLKSFKRPTFCYPFVFNMVNAIFHSF